jgi:branched-chain amino acid transport system permease protein
MTVPAIQIVNRLFSLNIGSNMRDLIAYSIVLVILIFRPHGLFGQAYSAKLRLYSAWTILILIVFADKET